MTAALEDARRGRRARRRRRGDRPPRRHLGRRAVRADPAGQHRRRLQPLRSGAPARRQAHRVRELEPRHRLLSPGRGDRRRRRRCGPTATTASARRSARTSSRFYFDRYGIETVCLRIGSSFPEPKDRRMLATWLSYDDLERLVVASLTAPVVGRSVVYGMSDNTTTWWDNTRRRTSAFGRRTARSVSAPPAEARQPVLDPSDPATIFRRRRVREAGAVRALVGRGLHGARAGSDCATEQAKARPGRGLRLMPQVTRVAH